MPPIQYIEISAERRPGKSGFGREGVKTAGHWSSRVLGSMEQKMSVSYPSCLLISLLIKPQKWIRG